MTTLAIWHGYLLGGTGSNIYTANMVEAWVKRGHHVVLLCQDPHPELHQVITTLERVRDGELVERVELHEPPAGGGHCTMVQGDLYGLLPVYLLDRYEGFEVKRFIQLDEDELARYIRANQDTMRYVLDVHSPEGVLVNHAVMGPVTLRPVLEEAGIPYLVKIHGSELEYAIASDEGDRFHELARDGLRGARRVLVGSHHIGRRMNELLGSECSEGRVELIPPGVDIDLFAPVPSGERDAGLERLVSLVRKREEGSGGRAQQHAANLDRLLSEVSVTDIVERFTELQGTYNERDTEPGAADRLSALRPDAQPVVSFVGKMIRQKGAQLLIAAMPVILQRHPDAKFVMVGFGQLRDTLEALVLALARGDRPLFEAILMRGNAFDGGPDMPFDYVPTFLANLESDGTIDAYFEAASGLDEHVVFTGQVDHAVLAALWPLCTASVVPSIASEAFGMVSAEAASCGSCAVVAHHSGLSDVADALAAGYPDFARDLTAFDLDDPDPVMSLATVLTRICDLDAATRDEVGAAGRHVVVDEWSWESIAGRIEQTFTVPAVVE